MKRKERECEARVAAAEKTVTDMSRELATESAKAARFEATAEALKSQLETTGNQATLWHEMFVDLQNRSVFAALV